MHDDSDQERIESIQRMFPFRNSTKDYNIQLSANSIDHWGNCSVITPWPYTDFSLRNYNTSWLKILHLSL